MSKAVDDVIVHHPDGLHVRIEDRRTDEGEPPALQILAHRIGLGGARGDIPHGSPPILDRATIYEAPLIRVEAAEPRLYVEKRPGVLDRRFDLRPVADDPRICQQRSDLALVVARALPWIEPVERAAVGVPLAQDRAPA